MNIKVIRDTFTDASTIGQLYIDGAWQNWTLELPTPLKGKPRIKGKTCVPVGLYQMTLSLYKGEVWEWMHKLVPNVDKYGLPQVYNIGGRAYPNWIDESDGLPIAGIERGRNVYVHIGNKPADTQGCLLVGLSKSIDRIDQSTAAFNKIYPQIVKTLNAGELVSIEYVGERS